ncbi:hypothetical protein OIC43_37035 [Streptomyces sp. NBC_00825]|uniref:hypothetical protein n=1 Tax=unclassified Streptomyces TaxID=2593676 RepID=UPI002ED5CBDC|nr:hypothetical protein OG832_06655 [Streptomyces sp. NBC_00826]WTH94242.1 hypothetical protein OIC43_37035 [Streptomyces sp. NBC_00825]WTI02977.1 hypothetical protein OHA23_37015 [Streptomyces sp. NBC_00822]
MTVTYYAPRPRPVDPRTPRPTGRPAGGRDVREILGVGLPAGYSWARRPALVLIHGGDPTAPGRDELQARIRMLDGNGGGAA